MVGFQVEPMSVNMKDMQFDGDSCNFTDGAGPQVVSFRSIGLLFKTAGIFKRVIIVYRFLGE